MKLWLIERTEVEYDEYTSVVVKARTKESALELVAKSESVYGFEDRENLTIKEIILDDVEEIVHDSFLHG